MKLTIGQLEEGTKVTIADDSPNEHIAIWGISGSGKSTRISEIMTDAISKGNTVVAFDLNGKDFRNMGDKLNRISAVEDGVNMSFLDNSSVEGGRETYANFISYLTDTFSSAYSMGVRQQGALRVAIEYAIQNRNKFQTEMEAIACGLSEQNSDVAGGVYNKMWGMLEGGVFRPSMKQVQDGKINVISLEHINPSTQKAVTEIILSYIWKDIKTAKDGNKKITLVIDEFQNLMFRKDAALLEMLRESRKYGVNLVLATQTAAGFSKQVMGAVNQTAIQLYFRTSAMDMKVIAEMIELQNSNLWLLKLKQLQVGQSIATGNLSVAGRQIHKPLIICSAYDRAAKNNTMVQLRITGTD